MDMLENVERSFLKKSKVVDLICILVNMLIYDSKKINVLEKVYGKNQIKIFKETYKDLSKPLLSLNALGLEILEFLLLNKEFDSIENFENSVRKLNTVDFLYHFFGGYIEKSKIQRALESKENLKEFYYEFNFSCKNLETLEFIFFNKDTFLESFFKGLKSLDTKDFNDYFIKIDPLYEEEFKFIKDKLKDNAPLEVSQNIMGKTFKNRGPYNEFIFIPSYFLPIKSVRFMDKDQILLYKILDQDSENEKKNLLISRLKVISDATRFEILEMLCNEEPLNGKEIAEKMKLSTPTISHHLEQLRESGFINEERVKNSKYFNANSNSIKEFINSLNKSLIKKKNN